MEISSRRAVEDYHRLLRDDAALVREIEDRFQDRLAAAKATFGGRALCSFPRPNLLTRADYEQIRSVCRRIFRAVEKVEAAAGETLWDQVGMTEAEKELARIEPGYARSSPLARIDSFLTTSAYQFVELNAETPAGSAYNDVLSDVFLELDVMKRFQQRYRVEPFRVLERLLETLVGCYREAGGRLPRPCIAVVDYDEVPTRNEHHLCREFFEGHGHPAIVCDPRQLAFESGELRFSGQRIDIVYKRLLVNELLERADELPALLEAVRAGAVTLVNPMRCKAIHKKAIFAVLTDEGTAPLLDEAERAAIAAHVPWTRCLRPQRTRYRGEDVDLLDFARRNRERLVVKPNDEYGGKGVFIGWELNESEWDSALERAQGGFYVVQERVELQRQTFPRLSPRLEFADLVVDLDPYLFDGEVEGFLTRLSDTSLANVSSGGGQVPSFLVEPR
jgi:hypothetical protein